MGRKLAQPLKYEEHLRLQNYMSEGQYGPEYSLYGVICHAGSGPHSGHYYAMVKSKSGRWYEMNDDSVTSTSFHPVKNAYILFYLQNKGQRLASAINSVSVPSAIPNTVTNLAARMKKRKSPTGDGEDGEEDTGVSLSKPFIGPILPSSPTASPPKRPKLSDTDPQAELLKRKIVQSKALSNSTSAFSNLANYGSDDDSDAENQPPSQTLNTPSRSSPLPPPQSSPIRSSSPPRSPEKKLGTVSTTSFYSGPTASSPGAARAKANLHTKKSQPIGSSFAFTKASGFNPYSRNKYGKRNRGI
jgi:ubiquitin carboxyl-terminal hydrolase 36/42